MLILKYVAIGRSMVWIFRKATGQIDAMQNKTEDVSMVMCYDAEQGAIQYDEGTFQHRRANSAFRVSTWAERQMTDPTRESRRRSRSIKVTFHGVSNLRCTSWGCKK